MTHEDWEKCKSWGRAGMSHGRRKELSLQGDLSPVQLRWAEEPKARGGAGGPGHSSSHRFLTVGPAFQPPGSSAASKTLWLSLEAAVGVPEWMGAACASACHLGGGKEQEALPPLRWVSLSLHPTSSILIYVAPALGSLANVTVFSAAFPSHSPVTF